MNIKEQISYSNGGILSKVIAKSGAFEVTFFCLGKGTELSEHTSTRNGFIYVIEGKGVFNLSGKDIEMFPGVFIQMDENVAHSLKAEENTSFLLVLAG